MTGFIPSFFLLHSHVYELFLYNACCELLLRSCLQKSALLGPTLLSSSDADDWWGCKSNPGLGDLAVDHADVMCLISSSGSVF